MGLIKDGDLRRGTTLVGEDIIASVQFNQVFDGITTLMDAEQKQLYENHIASLTKEYTEEAVIASCKVTNQKIINNGTALKATIIVAYKCEENSVSSIVKPCPPPPVWKPNSCKRLINDFTHYINEDDTIKEIEKFMKGISLPIISLDPNKLHVTKIDYGV